MSSRVRYGAGGGVQNSCMNKKKAQAIKSAVFNLHIEWRKHAHQRMMERRISRGEVINVLLNGDCIMEYPEDTPHQSFLFLGWRDDKPLHVVLALNEIAAMVYIITAYEPDLLQFEADYKTRRKK